MSARPRSWYDQVMTEDGSPAMLPLEDSPWLTTYSEVARLIEPHEQVVDLGCGTGRFIRLLYNRDHYAPVTGVDWSDTALDEAQRYAAAGPRHPDAPDTQWVSLDLDQWEPDGDRLGNCVFTCLETLEHLPLDRELVEKIPPGHRFVFTVPNFWSESHVRIFPSPGDAWRRYAQWLLFTRWIFVGSERQGIHIYDARRRNDSW